MQRLKHLIFILLMMASSQVFAIAYCALRDPVAAMQTLFPEATSHESIVRVISPDVRSAVADKLNFTLHFNELGKHTLYVMKQDFVPTGYIHARTESASWGLVEIIWSLDTALNIRDFSFQRCRSRSCQTLKDRHFASQLRGKGLSELKKHLSQDGQTLIKQTLSIPPGTESLVLAILRSAMKTIAVTDIAWRDVVKTNQLRPAALKQFPEMGQLVVMDHLYSEKTRSLIAGELQGQSTAIQRDTVFGVQVLKQGQPIGSLFTADVVLGETSGKLLWAFSDAGEVMSVEVLAGNHLAELTAAFTELIGTRLDSADQCGTAASLATYELMLVVKGQQVKP